MKNFFGTIRELPLSIIFSLAIPLLVILGFIAYTVFQGNIDRAISNFNKDTTTAKDQIYQTGSVRVYKFHPDTNTTCYLADKQGQSTSIFCK